MNCVFVNLPIYPSFWLLFSVGAGVGGCVGTSFVGFGVGFGIGVGVGFGIGVAVGFGIGVPVGFGIGVAVGFGIGVAVGFGIGVAVGFGIGGIGISDEDDDSVDEVVSDGSIEDVVSFDSDGVK